MQGAQIMNAEDAKWETVELFYPKSTSFGMEGARHAATEYRDKQKDIYLKIIDTAATLFRRGGGSSNILNELSQRFVGIDYANVFNVFSTDEKTFGIESPLPVLDEFVVSEWRARIDSGTSGRSADQAMDLGAFIGSALIFHMSKSRKLEINVNWNSSPLFMRALLEVSSMDAQFRFAIDRKTPVQAMLDKLNAEMAEALKTVSENRGHFSEIENEYKDFMLQLQQGIQEARSSIEALEKRRTENIAELEANHKRQTESLTEALSNLRDDSEKKLIAFTKTADERLKLKQVTLRWQRVKRNSFWTLIGTGLFILSYIGVGGIAMYCNARAIIDFLTPLNIKTIFMNGTATSALGMQVARITLLALPVITYYWILKIAVSVFVRSLNLMDDADQRATIMDSYYTLSGEGMTDERALPMMLWAIFRPLPGHGPDGIDPPDFTEAINAGLKGKFLDQRQ